MTSVNPDQPSTDDTPSSGTSVTTILACNSVSILACIVTLAIYVTLSMKAKYKRLMRRRSLVLAACMATSDLILHSSNLAGYDTLPAGFVCAFVGGWLFAAPTMLSIFYSCAIALNSQIAFVFKRRPPTRALGLFILGPIIITFIITFCALGTGVYGFDQTWGYCWYATEGIPASTVLIRILFTYSLPTLLCMLYLIIATVTISLSVFGTGAVPTGNGYGAIIPHINDTPFSSNTFPPSSPTSTSPPHKPSFIKSSLASLKEEVKRDRKPLKFSATEPSSGIVATTTAPSATAHHPKRSNSTGRHPSVHVRVEGPPRRLSRKTLVMRQLTIRLIGYIITPLLCLLPGIILDLITKVFPDLEVSTTLNAFLDGLNGLVGLFNSLLMLSDPALLAVWEDFRALVSKSTVEGSGYEAGGPGIGRGREMDDDVLASGFGLGARTRIDNVEEGIVMEEGIGGGMKSRGEGSGDRIRPISPIHSDGTGDIQDSASRRYPPRSDLRNGMGTPARKDVDKDERNRDVRVEETRQAGRGVNQGLEIHVRVDVTREATKRMSRIDQMEDWLDGL